MATSTSLKENYPHRKSTVQKKTRQPISDIVGSALLGSLAVISVLALILPMLVIVIVSFELWTNP